MIYRALSEWNAFEYVVIASLRTRQLIRGCLPRVPGPHKVTTTALLEVAADKIVKLVDAAPTRHS